MIARKGRKKVLEKITIVHNVTKLSAGKVTSTELGYKASCCKSKNRKAITDRNFYKKKSDTVISKVKLSAKKEV